MVTFGDISDGRRPVFPREYTYQLIFSPVVKSSGAVHFGLWSCWKGAGRPRLFLEVRITISPGVGCVFFLCFGSLLIFVGQRNFPLGFLLMFFYFCSGLNVGNIVANKPYQQTRFCQSRYMFLKAEIGMIEANKT